MISKKEMKKKSYESPAVLDRVPIELEQPILAGSVLDALNVKSQAQELEQVDASDVSFNHEWN